jgi:predicted Na+-dependent transporter
MRGRPCGAAGIMTPNVFSFMTSNMFTYALALLMFSMGITLTLDDFKRVFAKPGVVGLGFIACYVMMPGVAMLLGSLLAGPHRMLRKSFYAFRSFPERQRKRVSDLSSNAL